MGLQWWVYMIMAGGLFLGCLALNYLVKLMNDNRLEERINRLYAKTSTSTQVQVPLIEIETKKSAVNNEAPVSTGISLVFSKEDNKHKFNDISLDKITEESKSLDNSSKILGTLFSNKQFSSYDSFAKIQTEMGISTDSYYTKKKFLKKNQNVTILSPNDSTESALSTYKIKESNAVEDLKAHAEILLPIDYIIHEDVDSKYSSPHLPEHLFKDPEVFESKSECDATDVKVETNSSIPSADDSGTIKADQSDFTAFKESDKTLLPDAVSNISSSFNPDNIHCLGNIYHDTYLSPKDSVRIASNKKSNESRVDFINTKSSVINYDHDNNPCTSNAVTGQSSFHKVCVEYSNSSVCKDIVEEMVKKLDESDLRSVNVEGLEDDPDNHA